MAPLTCAPAWGICVGDFPPVDYAAVAELGINLVRTNARRLRTEPVKGRFNWAAGDAAAAQAEKYSGTASTRTALPAATARPATCCGSRVRRGSP